jgi:hypothetical protein
MTSREQFFLAARPIIVVEQNKALPAEAIQNDIFRPILKLQNEVLLAVFHNARRGAWPNFTAMPLERKLAEVSTLLQKENALRNQLLGMVLGACTPEELNAYFEQKEVISRRIHQLLAQRIGSQV